MFKGMSLNTKMLLAPVALIVVLSVIGGIGFFALTNTVKTYDRLVNESIPNLNLTGDMFLAYRQIRISVRTLGIAGVSKEAADKAVEDAKHAIEEYETANKEYSSVEFIPGEKELYEKVNDAWKDFKEVGSRVLAHHAAGTPEDKAKMIDIFFNDCPAKAKVFREAMIELRNFHKLHAKKWSDEAHHTSDNAKNLILFAIAFGLLAGIGLAVFTVRSVSGLIGSITQVATQLATGAEKVSTISTNVSEASEKLSSSAAQQAAALQETTSAVEETSAMVRKNAENAERSAEASASSQNNAEKGKRVVGEMITSIEEISASNQAIMQQIEASNKEMSDIVGVINEIGNKTKVINDIVFQTKLLSFNASVEAARAGEHGKGFAVVAEEVGNLAAMSGRSAKEITDLLETSTKRVQEIVANTQQKVEGLIAKGTERVNSGIATARNCDVVLGEIVTNVQSVSSMVSEIATASKEQSKGIGEINKAITELESAAQQNSATSHTAASSAEELTKQVTQLHATIANLNAIVRGGPAQPGAPAPTAQVISFPAAAKPQPVAAAPKFKKAVGGNPSASDPGFTEV